MKTLVILILLTLICFLRHSTSLQEGCCPEYSKTRIPRPRVKHVEMTPDHCQNKAIVVTTVCKRICIDHKLDWAKKLLSDFKNSAANFTTSAAALKVFKCKK
uniref:Chemokine interleukin-8-like domain-containing protein n=1 Tax=Lates calcarifer TaxID=8187 RepID=A0A4W6C699_LATCA